jgi:hypothetical protein
MFALLPRPRLRLPTHRSVELAADGLLFAAALPLGVVWQDAAHALATNMHQERYPLREAFGVPMIIMSICFVTFYVAPRLLYLAEDYDDPLTMLQILAVLGAMVLSVFLRSSA